MITTKNNEQLLELTYRLAIYMDSVTSHIENFITNVDIEDESIKNGICAAGSEINDLITKLEDGYNVSLDDKETFKNDDFTLKFVSDMYTDFLCELSTIVYEIIQPMKDKDGAWFYNECLDELDICLDYKEKIDEMIEKNK